MSASKATYAGVVSMMVPSEETVYGAAEMFDIIQTSKIETPKTEIIKTSKTEINEKIYKIIQDYCVEELGKAGPVIAAGIIEKIKSEIKVEEPKAEIKPKIEIPKKEEIKPKIPKKNTFVMSSIEIDRKYRTIINDENLIKLLKPYYELFENFTYKNEQINIIDLVNSILYSTQSTYIKWTNEESVINPYNKFTIVHHNPKTGETFDNYYEKLKEKNSNVTIERAIAKDSFACNEQLVELYKKMKEIKNFYEVCARVYDKIKRKK